MCGIAGAIMWNHGGDAIRAREAVAAMTAALSHRGPDGQGVVVCETGRDDGPASVVLGHRRLAIIDLSDRGAQPMRSREHPIWLTFNGEIYNFADVRRDLEALGRTFSSASDSEVILQGYEAWGERVIDRLRGMFALAIWDGRTGELLLARDRIGIKPLYFFRDADSFLFASEIRGLLASSRVPRRLDREAVGDYLSYQTVPPPRTLVKDVRMIPAGHLMRIGPTVTRREDRCYWDLLDNASTAATRDGAEAARAGVRERLAASTKLHLVSDVPVGIFLSGGIDSSALVALTSAAGAVPRTFSVVLPGSAHDEGPFARQIASRFGAEHTEIALGEADFRDQLPEATSRVDHPSGDGLNTWVVSRAVRAAGIKVALSGLGGDEVFGGYPSFRRLRRLARYAPALRRSPASLRRVTAAALRTFGGHSMSSVKAAAVLEGDGSVSQAFPVLRQLFTGAQRKAMLGLADSRRETPACDPYELLIERAVERHPEAGLMALVSYAEARTYMHDVLLRDTDQMSMAHGLEVRVPLLDHELVEYVMGLRDDVKEPGDVPKRLLVESLGDALPAECVHRPKQGFVLPFDRWMHGDLRDFCEHHLGPRGLEGRGVFREGAVRSLWAAFLAGDRRTTWSRPWALVALDAWIAANGLS